MTRDASHRRSIADPTTFREIEVEHDTAVELAFLRRVPVMSVSHSSFWFDAEPVARGLHMSGRSSNSSHPFSVPAGHEHRLRMNLFDELRVDDKALFDLKAARTRKMP